MTGYVYRMDDMAQIATIEGDSNRAIEAVYSAEFEGDENIGLTYMGDVWDIQGVKVGGGWDGGGVQHFTA